jgi:flagellar biosynthesis GTPase FlhF
MGPAVSGMVRRGANSEVARRMGEEANARLFAAREVGRIDRDLDLSILDLSGDLAKAKADRDRSRPTREEMDRGISDARRAYKQHKAEQAAQQLKAEREAERPNVQAQKDTPPTPPSSVARQEPKEAKPNSRNVQMAKSFANEPPAEAVKKYPELAGAYATVAAIEKKAEADGLDERQRAIVSARVREVVTNSIERGKIPNTKIREEKEVTRTRSNKRDYSR